MKITQGMVVTGMKKGIHTTLELAKVLIPATMVVVFLQASGGLQYLAELAAPLMGYFRLPGEAAIVLFSGYLINNYAAIAAMLALGLPVDEMVVLAVMFCFAHSLIIELAISKRAGAPIRYILPLRLGSSLLAGVVTGGLIL